MKSSLIIVVVVMLVLTHTRAIGQAPIFSQYYSSALYLNSALAGLEKDTYLGINYRSQWSNLGLPFSTFQFSFIQPITKQGTKRKHLGGVGLSLLNDVAGANKEFVTQGVSLAGAYNFHLNRHGNNIISAALQGGLSQQRINYNGLRWSSQYSSVTGFDQAMPGEVNLTNNQSFHTVLNAGVMWYYTDKQKSLSYYSTAVYNGISVSNILRSTSYYMNGENDLSILYKVHGGFSTTLSRRLDFSPNYLVQVQDNSFQVNIGMYMGYSVIHATNNSKVDTKVIVGLWYRLQDAIIFSTGLSNANWNLGLSYDSNIFSLSKTFGYGSAYELSLAYKIHHKNSFKRFSSPLI